jgi:hypothetical protein
MALAAVRTSYVEFNDLLKFASSKLKKVRSTLAQARFLATVLYAGVLLFAVSVHGQAIAPAITVYQTPT